MVYVTVLLTRNLYLLRIMSCITHTYCKLLWIKVSTKCLKLNPFFSRKEKDRAKGKEKTKVDPSALKEKEV